MATDRDEQLRQQQELEEIRRSFAEMGARMGSMFEPAEPEELQGTRQLALPAPPGDAPLPPALQGRPRWWWAAALTLLFLAGTLVGFVLPRGGDGGSPSQPPVAVAPTQTPQAAESTAPPPRVSVPEACLDAADKGDEVIARLTANIRDNRLAALLRDYTIASQACRREASP
jgi:hypothetical protein